MFTYKMFTFENNLEINISNLQIIGLYCATLYFGKVGLVYIKMLGQMTSVLFI